jgi:hypothetical protein
MKCLRGSRGELPLVGGAFLVLTILLTYPISLHPGRVAYTDASDAQFSIWNVGWVAHALLTDPRHVFDANIFYPHAGTLFYSEANLAAGALAAPVYWLTGNVFAAHTSVVVLAFLLAAVGMYSLVRYLTGNRHAAIVSGVFYAFCPHVYSHLHHIQLLMTAGLPFSLLAFHRLADRPTAGRGVALGVVMAAQAYACAYYAVFGMLVIGFAVLVLAGTRRSWRSGRYWTAVGAAAVVAMALIAPLARQYVLLHQATGFVRPIGEAGYYAADWRAYLASAAYAHRWMLPLLGHWQEVLFPGFAAAALGIGGAAIAWRRSRELVLLYGGIGAAALWASFGPQAGLYRLLYLVVPGFTFLRAPSRFGLLVVLALSVLSGAGLAVILQRVRHPRLVALAAIALAIGESVHGLQVPPVPPRAPAYERLALLPPGGLLELPVYSNRFAFKRARYMLGSTIHWQPLVNGYSDYIPQEFIESEGMLGEFPTAESLAWLIDRGVRYALFHPNDYTAAQRELLLSKLDTYGPRLRRLHADDEMWLYEVLAAGPDTSAARRPRNP